MGSDVGLTRKLRVEHPDVQVRGIRKEFERTKADGDDHRI